MKLLERFFKRILCLNLAVIQNTKKLSQFIMHETANNSLFFYKTFVDYIVDKNFESFILTIIKFN